MSDMGDNEIIAAWERGKPVDVDRARRSATSVLSIRLPDDVMTTLTDRARAEGKAAGTYARELLVNGLAEETPSTMLSLANMFSRWVSEAMSTVATSSVVFSASEAIAKACWVSYEKHPLAGDTYEFGDVSSEYFTFSEPVVTSRTREVETEAAGENAA